MFLAGQEAPRWTETHASCDIPQNLWAAFNHAAQKMEQGRGRGRLEFLVNRWLLVWEQLVVTGLLTTYTALGFP